VAKIIPNVNNDGYKILFYNTDIDKIKFEILSNVKIVCLTLSMAGSNVLTSLNQKFDTVVIDEAAQAMAWQQAAHSLLASNEFSFVD
jgi:hypothetical protein